MAEPKQAAQRKGSKKRLARDQIIAAAVRMADENGIEQLSMRQLAGQLGCGVMSIYHHIKDRDELVELMIDAIAKEIKLPTRLGTKKHWQADIKTCITSAYKILLKHHWAAKNWGDGNGPAKVAYHENLLRIMRQAGFPEELACRGYHALTMHVVGFAMQVLELRPVIGTKEKIHKVGHQILADMSREEFPFMVEHIEFHLSGKDTRNDFKYMRDLILDGLARDFQS